MVQFRSSSVSLKVQHLRRGQNVKSNNKKIERTEGIKNAKHTLLYFTTADKRETTTILSLELDIILSSLIKPKITAGCSRGFFLIIIIEGKAHS